MLRAHTFSGLWKTTARCFATMNDAGKTASLAVKSPLVQHLHDRIQVAGPMTVAAFMQECLTHPQHGYYMMNSGRPVFGGSGDFITAPEISQVFGELVGIWAVAQWLAAGKPARTRLVELGPGRGRLMADMLRAVAKFPALHAGLEVVLVEKSPAMQQAQREALATQPPPALRWLDHLERLEASDDAPYSIVVANEFFDALPTHQFDRTPDGWRERLVDAVEPTPDHPYHFKFVLAPRETATSQFLTAAQLLPAEAAAGSECEISVEAWRYCEQLRRVLAPGGCALIVDYGEEAPRGHTLRAFRGHAEVNLFDAPGTADVTVDVNFSQLRHMFAQLNAGAVRGPATQGDFLRTLGLGARMQQLLQAPAVASDPSARRALLQAANRLVDPKDMGTRFKAIGVACPAAAGFE